MYYKSIMHINPKDGTKNFHPAPVYTVTKTIEDLAKQISLSTTLTPVDIKAVIEALVSTIGDELHAGTKVKIESLGIFRVSFGGQGYNTPEEVTAKGIRGKRIVFIADPKLRKTATTGIRFSNVRQLNQKQEDSVEVEEDIEDINE